MTVQDEINDINHNSDCSSIENKDTSEKSISFPLKEMVKGRSNNGNNLERDNGQWTLVHKNKTAKKEKPPVILLQKTDTNTAPDNA